jgi:hypothetical protein
MLEAAPKHLFSNDFVVRSSVGSTTLDISAWRERAEFELGGVPHRLYREGMLTGAFVLERAGFVIARAVKHSVFRSSFDVEFNGLHYTLRKPSFFSRGFGVFVGDRQVGSIAPAGYFTRRTVVDLPSEWPDAVALFVFWLVLVMWKRQRAAAAAS